MRRSLGSGYRGRVTITTTSVRTLGALSAGLLVLGMLAGCTPEPEPKPTETALFASDEEAFAAAEETYRAYTDALNEVDTTDPATFESVFQWTTDRAEAAIRESLSELHAEDIRMTGDTVIAKVTPVAASRSAGSVTVHVCADVSKTDVIGEDGSSLVPEGRAPVQSLLVDLVPADSATRLKITSTEGDDSHSCSP